MAVLCALGSVVACTDDGGGGDSGAPGQAASASAVEPIYDWTFIYFGSADNNLETAMMTDVAEMLEVGFGERVVFYALFDRAEKDYSSQDGSLVDGDLFGLGNFSGTKAFEVRGGRLRELNDLGEVDMGDPDSLGWFVNQVMRVAPAKRTGLILSNHGLGSLAFGSDEGSGEVDTDLVGREIISGILSGLQGRRLDFVAFDACLSNNLELARLLTPATDLLLASEDVIPGLGFDYRSLRAVVDDPSMSAEQIAQEIIDAYEAQYSVIEPATTLALTDLTALPALEAAVANLASALRDNDAGVAYARAVADSVALMTLLPGSESESTFFVDLGDLARRLAQPGNPEGVRIAADAVFAAVERSVLTQYRGPARASATGISITNLPAPAIEKFYDQLSPEWTAWLVDFLDAVGVLPTSPAGVFVDGRASLDLQRNGVVVSADLLDGIGDSGALQGASGVFGVPTSDDGMEISVVLPATLNSGAVGRVAAAWDYRQFSISAGGVTDLPTVSYELSSGQLLARITGRLVSADGTERPMVLRFYVDAATGAPSSPSIWLQTQSGSWGDGAIALGDVFYASHVRVPASGVGLESVEGPGLSLDGGLAIDPEVLSAGVVAAGISVRDAADNTTTVFATGPRP